MVRVRVFFAIIFFLYFGIAVAGAAPALTYSTYLRDSFNPKAMAIDASGNIYLAGSAVIDPATSARSAMVLKLNPQASQYLYVSFLNGQANQVVNAIAIDSTGNVFVAGSYGALQAGLRSFVAKLDPNGDMLFSIPLGGSVSSAAQAIAVNAAGEIVVSGISYAAGFPSTPGAYSVPDTTNHPWLIAIDPSGLQTIFSATGIGGSAIALDAAGNLYVAGTTSLVDYPTTPGAYQTTFQAHSLCDLYGCSPGPNQYVSKIDPAGAKLIYSTALSGGGVAINGGLAVDAGGNAYVTGFAGVGYAYTVTPPVIPVPPINFIAELAALPFLSKLDPAGQNLLFSVPVGGTGVQVDAAGRVYAGGSVGSVPIDGFGSLAVPRTLPALADVPPVCLPNDLTIRNSAYVAQADATTGNILGTQFLGGSTLSPSAIAFNGSTLWIAGASNDPNVPFTPNALTLPYFSATLGTGAYLAAMAFSQPPPPAGTPQIACVLDGADLTAIGAVAPYQLVSIIGTGLGPDSGVAATDPKTTALSGVQVSFGTTPAPLLYVSSTQINAAVPHTGGQFTSMHVSVDGVSSALRAFPLVIANPSLFLNYQQSFPQSSPVSLAAPVFVALALNADGSPNSAVNPAQLGSTISVFVNGLTPDPNTSNNPIELFAPGWTVMNLMQLTPFVQEVSLQSPSALGSGPVYFDCPPNRPVCSVSFSLYYGLGTANLVPASLGPASTSAIVYLKR